MSKRRYVFTSLVVMFNMISNNILAQGVDTVKRIPDSLQVALQNDTVKKDTTRINDITNKDTVKPQNAYGAYIITGKVKDLNTGEGIPFATVFFPRTKFGIPADADGNFSLKMDYLPADTLHASAIGYDEYRKKLDRNKHVYNIVIELTRSEKQLNEVVIHGGEDPGLVLLKKIVSHKRFNNPDRFNNYGYEAYNKLEADLERLSKEQFEKIPLLKKLSFIYDNLDTTSESRPILPLYLTEALSDYYFQRSPKKQREFIKASQTKGFNNESITKLLGSMYQDVNIYDNFIPVFDKQFVSPISNAGALYYKYTIKDTERIYGHNIILVQFEARRPGENCFFGDFWVADTVFAIQRMSLQVPKLANVNWVSNVSVYKEYAPLNDSLWFCIKDKFIADFAGPYGLEIPGFLGRKTTTYRKIVVDDTSVTNVLNDKQWKEQVVVTDTAVHSDHYWQLARPDSLNKNEKKIYQMMDTLQTIPLFNIYKNTFKMLTNGMYDFGTLQVGPVWYLYSNNVVEGNRVRISLANSPKILKDQLITGYVAYGDKDKRFKYGATALWLLDRKPRMYVYGSYTHDIDFNTNYLNPVSADNIFSVLFRKPGIPWKLAFSNIATFEFYKEYYSGFSFKITGFHKEFSPYAPLPSTTVFTDMNGSPSTQEINTDGTIRLRFAYHERFLEGNYLRVSLGSKYPITELYGTVGVKGVWNSAYEYQKLKFRVYNTVKIAPFGTLYYNLFAGKVFGTLPYSLLEIHPGNEYLYYNGSAFEMMNKYEFLSDQYAGFNLEHNIGGGIFNYIPLMKKLKLRQFWTAKGVVGSLNDANTKLNLNSGFPFRTLKGDPYVELGTGVENILEMFRIDLVWRVSPPLLSTETQSRYFGIFGSVKFAF